MLQRCSVPLVVKIRLTMTGFGSESSSGHILNRGCPNSCVLESVSECRVLLTKLGPFFSLLTSLHLVSVWEAKLISPDFHCGLMKYRGRKAEEASQSAPSPHRQFYFQTHRLPAATCLLDYLNEHCPGNRNTEKLVRKWHGQARGTRGGWVRKAKPALSCLAHTRMTYKAVTAFVKHL